METQLKRHLNVFVAKNLQDSYGKKPIHVQALQQKLLLLKYQKNGIFEMFSTKISNFVANI